MTLPCRMAFSTRFCLPFATLSYPQFHKPHKVVDLVGQHHSPTDPVLEDTLKFTLTINAGIDMGQKPNFRLLGKKHLSCM